MAKILGSRKVKIAQRVIEVLEFFDQFGREATVSDIVRCYGRPQSSTSELLNSLFEMGLLYKDPGSRYYSPTPRVASLGIPSQPNLVHAGLFNVMRRLSQTTCKSVALFGLVGTNVQIFRRSMGSGQDTPDIYSGASEQLLASTAGHLLISMLPQDQATRLLWRLNAEAPNSMGLSLTQIRENISLYGRNGYAVGEAGFIPGFHVTAARLPHPSPERPLALGIFYASESKADTKALVAELNSGLSNLTGAHSVSFQMAS